MKKKQESNVKLVIVIILQVIIALILIVAIVMTPKKKCECVVIAESPILNTESIMQLKPMPIVIPPMETEILKPTAREEHSAKEVMRICEIIESEWDVKIPDMDKISLIDGNATYREVIDKVVK